MAEFQDDNWPHSAEHYELLTLIGKGAFAKVWRARCILKGIEVAIKVMDLEKIHAFLDDVHNEVQAMRLCDHPNVLRCHASFIHREQLWLVMQLMDKGSCLHVMNTAKSMDMGEGMKEEWLAYILKQALLGIKYLHDHGQIHRDIKAGNILLNSEGQVCIADLGVSSWLISHGGMNDTANTFVGTPCWMAPEVMEQVGGYDFKADIWSFGITALELAKGFAPYAHYPPMKVLLLTVQEDPPSLKSYRDDRRNGIPFSRPFKEIIKLCLQKDPKKRPTATTLLTQKFFKTERSPQPLVDELLSVIPSIGTTTVEDFVRPQGAFPIQGSWNEQTMVNQLNIESKTNFINAVNNQIHNDSQRSTEFQSGTTWVFDDGSMVVLKPGAVGTSETNQKIDDDDEIYDVLEQIADENFLKS